MAIPDYQTIMLPLLRFLADEKEHTRLEAERVLADEFRLTPDERAEVLPSGQQRVLQNRVGWARFYLSKAGLVWSPRRGFHTITPGGMAVLAENPNKIDNSFLRRFPEFVDFMNSQRNGDNAVVIKDQPTDVTPQESIEAGYQRLRAELADQLLAHVKQSPPEFFEQLVVDLLVRMGYGGSRRDAGSAIGRSGDGGIDGIIKEDRLGLDAVYIQAKRWDSSSVGRPDIQRFVGALAGQRARKGVFITTSTFSSDARSYVSTIESKIVLIDGQELAQLMIDYNLGVVTVSTYELKRVDSDYFTEE